LTPQQRHDRYVLAKEDWLKAESMCHAYDRAFRRDSRLSSGLKLATTGAALLTAVSTAIPSAGWATVVTGVLTAALATIDQQYSPTKSSQGHWDDIQKLDDIKRELTQATLAISEAQEPSAGDQALTPVRKRFKELAPTPIRIVQTDHQKAREAFMATLIAVSIDRTNVEMGIIAPENAPSVEMAEDAPDILPVYRSRARSGAT
jgi:hypothetical protein